MLWKQDLAMQSEYHETTLNIGIPVIGICAAGSNAGKTTLITQLIPALAEHRVRTSVIKHAHHRFDIDHPGKDSYQIREAGAVQTLVASNLRWALMTERQRTANKDHELDLTELLQHIDIRQVDLILVEGFKSAAIPKIEVYRAAMDLSLLAPADPYIIAVASDIALDLNVPVLDLNKVATIADFILLQMQRYQDLNLNL
jgi:molybdopterin-guanine dinucleotide biosynthesis protein B